MSEKRTMAKAVLATVLLLPLLVSPPAKATIHTINVGNFFFSPLKTIVTQGDTVRWVWISGLHSTTSRLSSPKQWNSGLIGTPGAKYDLVITTSDPPGLYPYYCTVHPIDMQDTLIVIAAPAPADPTVYGFFLEQDQENSCAGSGSPATGFCVAILNGDSTQLSLYVEHNVAGVNAAHVHLGAPCVDGGVVFGFSSPASPIYETWNLTPTDVANLVAGNLYVNIHSPTYPAGAVRGQIVQEPLKFVFTLDEEQADGGAGTGSFAAGLAFCELDAQATEFSIELTHDVQNANNGHVHYGIPGVEGGIAFGFGSSLSPISENWDIDTLDLKELLAGRLYINVHSTAFPAGEIRGQIVRQEIVISSLMDGDQANGGAGTGSSATGFCVAVLGADLETLSIYCEHDVVSPIDAHVHLGPPGVEGPIVFGFTSPTSPINETFALSSTDLENLCAGNLYVNIHSTAEPTGEIRGQLTIDAEYAFNFGLDESQANSCVGTGSPATGDCQVRLKPGGRELTILLTHDVSQPIDGHVHLGAPCVSGAIQFGFSQSMSPIEEFWYLGPVDIINLWREDLYVNVHSVPFPVEEIRGQIANTACFCGDADGNGGITISDAVFLINFIFAGGPAPNPLCLGDADGNGSVTISDAVFLINFIFAGGPSPACP